ncbi:MAG: hypothetical protein KAT37_02515 [Candidatus Aenigmarchaeota archaeon]|nr:hypothetical protein [Candidatus Aenigmarchaeota archaeon]
MVYRWNFFLEGTDLMLSPEERKKQLRYALQNSQDDRSLIKKYFDGMSSISKSCCSHDCIRDVFSWGFAYKLKDSPEKGKEIERKNLLLFKAVNYRIGEINKNREDEQMAKTVYELIEPRWNEYMHNFILN